MSNLKKRLEALEKAQQHIEEAVSCIRDAVFGTSLEAACEAYIIGHLNEWADGTNPYDATNIPNLMESLIHEAFDEEE